MEDWAEIRRLHRAEQMPIRAIARKLGVGRNTVRRALESQGPPKYVRKPSGSIVDAVEPRKRCHAKASGGADRSATRPAVPGSAAERRKWPATADIRPPAADSRRQLNSSPHQAAAADARRTAADIKPAAAEVAAAAAGVRLRGRW